MDENKIIELYVNERMTLRSIAKELGTNHHKIKNILDKNGIELNTKNRKRRKLTDEHKEKISLSSKGREGYWKGKKMSKETVYKNMKNHLQWDIELEFLTNFEDIDKLKILNGMLTRDRVSEHFDTAKYKKFIEKFYKDKQFNKVYEDWMNENKANYAKPSLDHIIPLSKGGTWELDNLQILSWVENRAKINFMPEEWEYIKNKYFR